MQIQKITQRKIYEVIAEQIKDMIVKGTIKPGDKLPSAKELSERYQVGRSTVREALSALKAMGLVDIRQGEGSYVRSIESHDVDLPELNALIMSRDTVLELIEARKALEISNAGLAAEKRTEDDLHRFEEILLRMEQRLGDEEEGEASDMQFHFTLAEAAHNSIMLRLIESISSQMKTAIHETRRLQMYSRPAVAKQLLDEHRAIYEAVKLGDALLAQEAMRKHLFHVEQVIVKFIRK